MSSQSNNEQGDDKPLNKERVTFIMSTIKTKQFANDLAKAIKEFDSMSHQAFDAIHNCAEAWVDADFYPYTLMSSDADAFKKSRLDKRELKKDLVNIIMSYDYDARVAVATADYFIQKVIDYNSNDDGNAFTYDVAWTFEDNDGVNHLVQEITSDGSEIVEVEFKFSNEQDDICQLIYSKDLLEKLRRATGYDELSWAESGMQRLDERVLIFAKFGW